MNNSIETEDRKRLINNLKAINVKFNRLDKKASNLHIWGDIYNNSLYEINEHMLKEYFSDKADFWSRSYTYISLCPNKSLKEYVDKNIAKYIKLMLYIADKNSIHFCDDEKSALEIMNNDNIALSDKNIYISKLKTQISNIDHVANPGLYDNLMDYELLPKTAHTVLKYFSNIKNDANKFSVLCKYINSLTPEEELKFESVEWSKYSDLKREFYKFIIASTSLGKHGERIVETAHNLNYEFSEIADYILPRHVEIMIKNNILSTSVDTCQRLIDSDIKNLQEYIAIHCDMFCSYYKSSKIKVDEAVLVNLLDDTNEINSIEQKLEIVRHAPTKLPFNWKYMYSPELCKEFLQNHLCESYVKQFISCYGSTKDDDLKSEILRFLTGNKNITDYTVDIKGQPELYTKLVSMGALTV